MLIFRDNGKMETLARKKRSMEKYLNNPGERSESINEVAETLIFSNRSECSKLVSSNQNDF